MVNRANLIIVVDGQDKSRFRHIDADQLVDAAADMRRQFPLGKNPRYYAALELAGFEASPNDDGSRYDVFPLNDYLVEIERQAVEHEKQGDSDGAAYLRVHAAEVSC